MATYEIVPQTTVGLDSAYFRDTGLRKCREMCDGDRSTAGFSWTSKEGGACTIHTSIGQTVFIEDSTLYIKRKNKSYALLWVFFILLGILIFISLCKR